MALFLSYVLQILTTLFMRRISIFCCLFFLGASTLVNAQEYKKFKVGIGVGFASPAGEGSKSGFLAYVEPAYRITDVIAVGLRVESAVIGRGYSDNISTFDIDIAALGSYTVNGQYYFSNNSFRPFAGFGFGVFSLAAIKASQDGVSETVSRAESQFGFYPRVGFDLGHFNFSIDYNIVPSTKVEGGNGEFKNNYIGFRIGGSFGGGKK
jgi:hypothetical protein